MKRARPGSPHPSLCTVLALAALAAPSVAAAQVDPARAFYAVAFTHGSPHNGVLTAQDTEAPFGVIASATRGTLNGAIALDPVRGVIYGSACCAASQAIQAYEPVGLTRFAARDIPVTSSGSLAIEVDAPRRVLFFYDTVTRVLRALSLTDGAQYGGVVAMITLTDLPAEPVATSAGDQLAVDTRGQQLFVTGGDGGPVLAVDVSRITESGGAFGAVTDTGHRNRTTGNSGGGVAVDEAGRRAFFFPTTGAVRIVGADAPFAVLGEVVIPSMAANDCGLMFDGRTSRLYVGRGASAPPVAVSFPSLSVTAFATGPGEVPALSFAGAGTACVDRDADGFFPALCAPTGARVDCDDARSERSPGAAETCDGADNDCDGLVDEGFCRIGGACFTDGQANPANACEACAASAAASGPTAWRPGARGAVCRAA
ncbi:MAG: putative metal-binding motif-containing protein, partial [Deltaproteobacteria bacterium]|nr:putative metal-binding motif-containing protein [Deltaproteobacteria bacterium]